VQQEAKEQNDQGFVQTLEGAPECLNVYEHSLVELKTKQTLLPKGQRGIAPSAGWCS
tara:strand:+ start:1420 stop:1590 length:171 start_codon:yes stop_codon:yes gene_type:complete